MTPGMESVMGKDRLAAFSDGVVAIIITIMVLELKMPQGPTGRRCRAWRRCFASYVISFVYLGIYWNNHHHLLHAVDAGRRPHPVGQSGPAVLALAHSVRRRLDGENYSRLWPTALYGGALLMPAIAYFLLQLAITCTARCGLCSRQGPGPRH